MQQSEIETSDLSTLKTPHIAVRAGGEKIARPSTEILSSGFLIMPLTGKTGCWTINRDSIKWIKKD
jgi:hypothetical protein